MCINYCQSFLAVVRIFWGDRCSLICHWWTVERGTVFDMLCLLMLCLSLEINTASKANYIEQNECW